MAEYLSPGVFVEDTSFRSKSIDGVSTSTTGFVGPTRFGRRAGTPNLLTSLLEFEHAYGDGLPLEYGGASMPNYLWHAARAFFDNGGRQLYIARVFRPLAGPYPPPDFALAAQTTPDLYDDGHARATIGTSTQSSGAITMRARFPGAGGNLGVQLTVNRGRNLLGGTTAAPTLTSLADHDAVWIGGTKTPRLSSTPEPGAFYLAEFDTAEQTWRFRAKATKSPTDLRLHHRNPKLSLDPTRRTEVRVISLTVTLVYPDTRTSTWDGLPLDPRHEQNGMPDSVSAVFADASSPPNGRSATPLVMTLGREITDGLALLRSLIAHKATLAGSLNHPTSTATDRSVMMTLHGGNDGQRPTVGDYRGVTDAMTHAGTGLRVLEQLTRMSR